MTHKFIFIYNAKSGVGNAIADSIHKFVSPATYPCQLCDLTHGYFGAKKQRNDFIALLPIPVEFYHNNELHKLTFEVPTPPCILLVHDSTIIRSFSGTDRTSIQTLDDLIEIIQQHIPTAK